ncbi:C-type lectin domain family 4 member E isoform X1 [Salmo salar]|uniref:C-type lectin domain family 4 member E isoform X1 n=1 Tax=Salmo salar TaxID=8030 RepID=A0A1S3SPS9_SALSA|nr:C-type lectin domain family 4 member E-like isoform X1 [Salmo salar]|eukprot:XP_014066337.1 PREDICTED: C-type lectin domain family 4 member E-like isoform X1 [Salmo salar]
MENSDISKNVFKGFKGTYNELICQDDFSTDGHPLHNRQDQQQVFMFMVRDGQSFRFYRLVAVSLGMLSALLLVVDIGLGVQCIHKLMHTVQFNSEPMHIKGFWIGLKEEEDTEGTWTWLDGTDLTQGYWEDGEPNDHYGMEDFAAIKINPMKFWNDATCTSEMQSRKA